MAYSRHFVRRRQVLNWAFAAGRGTAPRGVSPHQGSAGLSNNTNAIRRAHRPGAVHGRRPAALLETPARAARVGDAGVMPDVLDVVSQPAKHDARRRVGVRRPPARRDDTQNQRGRCAFAQGVLRHAPERRGRRAPGRPGVWWRTSSWARGSPAKGGAAEVLHGLAATFTASFWDIASTARASRDRWYAMPPTNENRAYRFRARPTTRRSTR